MTTAAQYAQGQQPLGPGSWEQRAGVRTFVPFSPAPATPPAPRKVYDLSKLIACPTCRATVTQTCRTTSGHTTTPHGSRLAPRLCPCGIVPPAGSVMCRSCSAESLQRSKNEHGRRRRSRAAA